MSARSSLTRIAVAVGAGSVASAGFALATGEFVFVRMQGWTVAVAVGLGVLALLAALVGSRVAVLATGVLFLIAAVTQVALWTSGDNRLGGTGSTASLWLGLGIALAVAGLAPTLWPDPSAADSPAPGDSPSETDN
jgi:hypothetical protein